MRQDTRTPESQAADRQAKLDALHKTLTDAVQALVTGEDWRRAIEFAAKFRRYSFGNSLLLMQQGLAAYEAGLLPDPFPDYVAGYRQWQSLGRQVRAGTRGFQILAPTTARVVVAEDGSYRRLARGEKPAPGETTTTRMVGVRPATVFPAAYTDGETPIPQRPAPQLLQGRAPPGLWDGLAALIRETVPDPAASGPAAPAGPGAGGTVGGAHDPDPRHRVHGLHRPGGGRARRRQRRDPLADERDPGPSRHGPAGDVQDARPRGGSSNRALARRP
ncbi:ArdC family protein [Antribacter sp. KLBMP9083]|uniref:ArdC family protein n=1 Tax=Antribacter soli TaxID=2910976 RepID=A0AA41QGK5_9MICO|nr:ArdC family protein [Antribacter soli]MCF4123085.1 ArdC family protein [Antribacter soli]